MSGNEPVIHVNEPLQKAWEAFKKRIDGYEDFPPRQRMWISEAFRAGYVFRKSEE